MPVDSILAFWGVALLLIGVPGADWAFTISAGLRSRSVLPAVSGLLLGYAGMTVVVAAGIGVLVAENPNALTGLTVVGGVYLMWHGARTLASPAASAVLSVRVDGAVVPVSEDSGWVKLAQGVGVSGLNPKGLLILLALLPQFTSPAWDWPVAVQISALGLVFIITCAIFYFTLGSFTRIILQARPTAARAVSRLSGVGMVVVGAALIFERFA